MKGIPQGRYTKEFREEAVKMVEEGSNSGHYGVYRDFLQEAAPIGKVAYLSPVAYEQKFYAGQLAA